MKKQQGFNLIELVIFIVVIGIAAIGIMMSFRAALETNPDIVQGDMAVNLTQGRLQIILGQYKINGFSSFSDICSSGSLALCSVPAGFTVASSIADNWNGNNRFKVITVTTTETSTGDTLSSASALVANF